MDLTLEGLVLAVGFVELCAEQALELVQLSVRALVERFDAVKFSILTIFAENDRTLEGSFSFVAKPMFATKYSSFSIFQDL